MNVFFKSQGLAWQWSYIIIIYVFACCTNGTVTRLAPCAPLRSLLNVTWVQLRFDIVSWLILCNAPSAPLTSISIVSLPPPSSEIGEIFRLRYAVSPPCMQGTKINRTGSEKGLTMKKLCLAMNLTMKICVLQWFWRLTLSVLPYFDFYFTWR